MAWCLPTLVSAQTPPGTDIPNQAEARFLGTSGLNDLSLSNEVIITTVARNTPAELFITRIVPGNGSFQEPVGPALCAAAGGPFALLADPVLIGNQPIDPMINQELVSATSLHAGEPVFVRVADMDQNFDPNLAETLDVTLTSSASGDSELLRLTETGPNTGVFAGYLPTASGTGTPDNCVLELLQDSDLAVDYVDPNDGQDAVQGRALVDPLGVVFDSATGAPVDGATVTLIDNTTGQPAMVFGDDGVSTFPATVESGSSATDSGGTLYTFPAGGFRFPLVSPGRYRLEVEPPSGYNAPSTRSTAELDVLPGAPFAIGPGSFNQEFIINPGPVIVVDIPVDPFGGSLFLQKTTQSAVAAPGDFVEYTLTISNADGFGPATGVVLQDVLPPGFRFVPGSVRVDGNGGSDPSQGTDGRNLSFPMGDIASGVTTRLQYVAIVGPGAAPGQAINTAVAQAGADIESNEARAAVEIVEDLFRSKAIIVGRLIQGSCDQGESHDIEGLANARVYLEDGRYALTDEDGRYHFEGLEPGVHIVQLDLDSLPDRYEVAPCDDNNRFAEQAFSQFVDVRGGTLWRADFYLRPKQPPSGFVDLKLEQSIVGEELRYRASLKGDGLAADGLTAMVMMPDGVRYQPGSARLGKKKIRDPRRKGNVVTFDLGDRNGEWEETLAFTGVAQPTASGKLVTRAIARFGVVDQQAQTPTAETRAFRRAGTSVRDRYVLSLNFDTLSADLSDADRILLDRVIAKWVDIEDVHLKATGHSDTVPIAVHNRHIFEDNYALSRARAAAAARYVRDGLKLKPGRISYRGLGPDQPVADNGTEAGRRENRRVELEMTGLRPDKDPELRSLTDGSDYQRKEIVLDFDDEASDEWDEDIEIEDETNVAAAVNRESEVAVDELSPGIGWVTPAVDYAPPIPSIKVAIQHEPTMKAALLVNGEPVSPLNFDGTDVSANLKVALSRWRGIDLKDGPNRLEAEISQDGRVVQRLERDLHFAGPPIRGRLLVEESRLRADGRRRPNLAIQFVDRWGQPARRGTVGGFRVDPPYRSWWEVQNLKENQLVFTGDRSPTFRIGKDGVANIQLEPTSQTGQVLLHLEYPNEREEEITAWLSPEPRDWILVGVAEGTAGYNSLSKNMELAEDQGFDEHYYDKGRLAFFAKGRIKGEYLLTMAFDSSRRRKDSEESLLGVIDPNRYYTLYGDGTEQRFEAPTQRQLYLKLERNAFVALFGDFETGLTVTELGRYSRVLNGFKSEFHGDRTSYSMFAARTNQAFQKDEFLGDGTSGPYALSNTSVIANSETVTLETRDRFRPEVVVDSRVLQRFLNYSIDYINGTIFFKEPVRSRDVDFNPIYVVVDYETRSAGGDSTVAGGRAALHLADNKVEIGTTAIREGVDGAEGDLYAVDLRVDVAEGTELIAEVGSSEVADPLTGDREGDAYILQLTRRVGKLDAQAYVREQEGDYGLGQQRGTEAGTKKAGVDARAELSDAWHLNAEVFRQENLDTDGVRDMAQAEVRYQDPRRTGTVGARHVADDIPGQGSLGSDQVFAGASWKFWDDLVTARINAETNVGGGSGEDSVDYPTRSLFGLDWALRDFVTLFAEYEIADGSQLDSQMTRIGIRANPWQRTQVNTTLNREMTEYGPRTFANLGLVQAWQINEHWAIDFGLDQANTVSQGTVTPFDADVPLASGGVNEDFNAFFAGALYRDEDWTFSSRLERRDSDYEDRTAFDMGFYRERRKGRGFSAQLLAIKSEAITGLDTLGGDLSLGWAYRPSGTRWIILDRLDFIYEERRDLLQDVRATRFVNNLNANWLPNSRNQVALQFAAKYVRANFEGFSATGYLDLWGTEYRRTLTRRFDLGFQGSIYRAPDLNVLESSLGIDLGITLAKNIWLSLGYNFTGFDDEDFSRNRYSAQGPFFRVRVKVDQASLKSLLSR